MKQLVLPLLLALAAACAAGAETSKNLLGQIAPEGSARRSITLEPTTRRVNVVQGETVRFLCEGGEFTFRFNGPSAASFDLQRVAPPEVLKHPVTVYIQRTTDADGLVAPM